MFYFILYFRSKKLPQNAYFIKVSQNTTDIIWFPERHYLIPLPTLFNADRELFDFIFALSDII